MDRVGVDTHNHPLALKAVFRQMVEVGDAGAGNIKTARPNVGASEMAIHAIVRNVGIVILAVGLMGALSGCAHQRMAEANAAIADYCQSQGSADGIAQCQQYYPRHPNLAPPQPIPYPLSNDGNQMDPVASAALLGALLSRPQVQPVQIPFYPMQIPQSHSFSCYTIGNMTNCN
jgi:hypothetical protein